MRAPVVRIRSHALRVIIAEAPASADGRETGGILLGHDPAADGGIEVTTASDPGPAADRRPDGFTRDLAHAQRLADQAYDRDGSVWLGEWHTHPTGPATPSSRDMSTYQKPGSGSETHQHFSPAGASCCYSLLLDPNAMIGIDLHKRLFLLVTGRGE